MRGTLRALWRSIAALAVVKACYLAWWLGWLVSSDEGWVRLRRRIFRWASSTLLRVFGARLETSGSPPRAPFVLVCNHLSYLDVLVLASQVQTVFVAKSEVASWPLLGPLCRSMGTIFIDRKNRRDISRVLDETSAALARGDGVVIFPEGTSTQGADVLPFLPSLLATPVRLAQPVSHASLSYATPEGEPPAHLAVCWWGGMTFPDHFWRLLHFSRIDVRLTFGERPISSSDRKQLARDLHRAVVADFTPVVAVSGP